MRSCLERRPHWSYWPGGFEWKNGDVLLEVDERKCRIMEVEAIQAVEGYDRERR